MADYVKDAILLNQMDDLVLLRLIELTISSDRSGRPLFPGLLQEPAFFRKCFQVWIHEALDEKQRLNQSQRDSQLEIE